MQQPDSVSDIEASETVIDVRPVHVWLLLLGVGVMVVAGWFLGQSLRRTSTPSNASTQPGADLPFSALQGAAVALLQAGGPIVGQEAPDFTLYDLNGQPLTLSQLRGQAVLVNFWATWCPPCKAEMPALVDVYNRYKDQGFVVVAVDIAADAGPEAVKAFVKQYNMNFPVVFDSQGQVERTYRLRGYPTSVFINREGKITSIVSGGMPLSMIESKLKDILP